MKQPNNPWPALVALARQAGDDRDCTAPYGFATRVAAQATVLSVGSPWPIMERLALRGLMVAAACSLAAVAFNYSSLSSEMSEDYTGNDTLVELLELS